MHPLKLDNLNVVCDNWRFSSPCQDWLDGVNGIVSEEQVAAV
jgi:hypothetical protein